MSINQRLNRLIDELRTTPRAFAIQAGVEPAKFHHYVSGRLSEPGAAVLAAIKTAFTNVNMDWLIAGVGPMFTDAPGVRQEGKVMGKVIDENKLNSTQNWQVAEEQAPYGQQLPVQVFTVDKEENELIPIVPIKAAAGSGYINQEDLLASDYIHLPQRMLKPGVKMAIQVRGESMSPTFLDGDQCIIRLLERSEWRYMPDEHVYVITDRDGQVYFKRVKNRWEKGFITLMSDNPDKATYGNFNLGEDEVLNIWYWHCKISFKAPNIHNMFYSRLSRMEDSIEMLAEEVETIKKHQHRPNS